MGESGSPYARFRRALDTRNLHLVRAAAAELPGPLPLLDALEVLALIREREPRRYGRAAARFTARTVHDNPHVVLDELVLLTAALADTDGALVERVRAIITEA